jgi:hemerythrin
MHWQEHYTLGYQPMDDMHKEFIERVNALADADDDNKASVLAALEDLLEHANRHFGQEDRWMQESGFPPLRCHTGEHERVCASLHSIIRVVKNGNPCLGKVVARELESWFDNHAATMDTALAQHMRYVGYSPYPQQPSSNPD